MVSGSLHLSGAIVEQATAGAQRPSAGCHLASVEPLLSEVDFSSGSSLVILQFLGAPGTTKLPLPDNGPPGDVTVHVASGAQWGAGQDFPRSEGTLTLSQSSDGTITGQVTATLEPVMGSTETLEISGHWHC